MTVTESWTLRPYFIVLKFSTINSVFFFLFLEACLQTKTKEEKKASKEREKDGREGERCNDDDNMEKWTQNEERRDDKE